jgi:hypothetical protein
MAAAKKSGVIASNSIPRLLVLLYLIADTYVGPVWQKTAFTLQLQEILLSECCK